MLKKTLTRAVLLVFVALIVSVVSADETLEAKVAELKEKWNSSQHGPPAIHMIDDHWTAWYPPADVSDDAYIIKQGDTLWDLALEFFGDNYLWPQLWECNMYIKDAHWIYPGDPLSVKKPVIVDENDETYKGTETEVEDKPDIIAEEVITPGTIALYQDLYCSPYIEESFNDNDQILIMGAEESKKSSLSERDIVYINAGSSHGLTNEGFFGIYRAGAKLDNPMTGKSAGTVVDKIGKIEILNLMEHTATGVIVEACTEVRVGDFLLPWKPVGNPEEKTYEFNPVGYKLKGKTSGHIIYAKDGQQTIGDGNIAIIDIGSSQGIQPGDYFIIYQDNELGSDYDIRVLGELAVLFCEQNSSTCKTLISRKDIPIGSKVELR